LRFADPTNKQQLIGAEAATWLPVDLYVGGQEHAVLHLLYARFWHKVLFDLGVVDHPEPFKKLVHQGMILGADGEKMSKSRGNVINPDDVVKEHGADALRLYEMFMGPLEAVKPWQTNQLSGVVRFRDRVFSLVCGALSSSPAEGNTQREMHKTIKKVTSDVESLSFNTAIAQMMVLTNAFTQTEVRPVTALVTFLKVLSPFAPHLAEELYAIIRSQFPQHVPAGFVADVVWPTYDPAALIDDEIEIVIQVNGKRRDSFTVPLNTSKEEIEKQALASPRVAEFTVGLTIRKVIYVPGKLVNIVAN